MDHLPVIDVSDLADENIERRRAVAALLGAACRNVGFFYVVGHGISEPVRDGVFEAARRFFACPADEKERLSIRRSAHNRGYVGFGTERLDETSGADRKEAFNLGLELAPDDPELLAGMAFRGVNLWPSLADWRGPVLDYYGACQRLQLRIHRGFALDLGVDEAFFSTRLDRPSAVLRLLHYPASETMSDTAELGAGAHTDYGNLTILATDGVAGLQVRGRDGVWLDAPHIEGAFVCNIGDCLMRWTNDVYVSTPHRVLRPKAERYSVAFFADANPDALVEVLPSCLRAGEVPRYAPVTTAEYLRQRLDATYAHLTPTR